MHVYVYVKDKDTEWRLSQGEAGVRQGVDGALHSSRRAGRRVDGSAFQGMLTGVACCIGTYGTCGVPKGM